MGTQGLKNLLFLATMVCSVGVSATEAAATRKRDYSKKEAITCSARSAVHLHRNIIF